MLFTWQSAWFLPFFSPGLNLNITFYGSVSGPAFHSIFFLLLSSTFFYCLHTSHYIPYLACLLVQVLISCTLHSFLNSMRSKTCLLQGLPNLIQSWCSEIMKKVMLDTREKMKEEGKKWVWVFSMVRYIYAYIQVDLNFERD